MKKIISWLKDKEFLSKSRKELLAEYGSKLSVEDLMRIKALIQLDKRWASGICILLPIFYVIISILTQDEMIYYFLLPVPLFMFLIITMFFSLAYNDRLDIAYYIEYIRKKNKLIKVCLEFSNRLTNRNKLQGDGKFTAMEFRNNFLYPLYIRKNWNDESIITLDFSGVKVLSPTFANEAFTYFKRFETSKKKVKDKIIFINCTNVQERIIEDAIK